MSFMTDRNWIRNLSFGGILFWAIGFFSTWFYGRLAPDHRIYDGIIGTPNVTGISEAAERYWVGLIIVGVSAILIAVWQLTQRRNSLRLDWATLAAAFSLVGFLGENWVRIYFLVWAALLFPYPKITVPFYRWARRFQPTAPVVVGAFALTLFFGQRLLAPWPIEITPTSWAGPASGGVSFLTLALAFKFLRRINFRRWTAFIPFNLALLTLPILPLVRLVAFTIEAATPATFHSLALPAAAGIWLGFTAGLARLPVSQKRESNVLHFFSLPVLFYIVFFRFHFVAPFEMPHEADIFQDAFALFSGKVPYQDIFLTHGVGNGCLIATAFKIWGPTISSLRLTYHLLGPLIWSAHYQVFAIYFKRRNRSVVRLSLLTFFAVFLSGFYSPFVLIGYESWFSGTKQLIPLVLIGATFRYLRGSYPGYFGAMGALVAAGIFQAPEIGIAMGAFAGLMGLFSVPKLSRRLAVRAIFHTLFGFLTVSALLWLPLAPLRVILAGLYFHLVQFPKFFSQFWGLPFFLSDRPLTENLVQYLPFVVVVAVLFRSVVRRETALLPLTAFAFVIFQAAVIRSDAWHFRAGLGLSGLLLVTLLLQYLEIPLRRLTLSLGILFIAGTLGQIWENPFPGVFRKRENPPDRNRYRGFDAALEGKIPSLTHTQIKLLQKSRAFVSRPANFMRRTLYLTESAGLLQRALGVADILPLTLYHYLLTAPDQRRIRDTLTDIDFIFYETSPLFDGLGQFVRRPVLAQFIYQNYVPCEAVSENIVVLAKKNRTPNCHRETLTPAVLGAAFPHHSEIGHLASFLGGASNVGEAFPELGFLEFSLMQSAPAVPKIRLEWDCHSEYAFPRQASIGFVLLNGKTPARHWVPLAAHPQWNYCRGDLAKVRFYDDKSQILPSKYFTSRWVASKNELSNSVVLK